MTAERLGIKRLRIRILGAVQGVGFRPFVFRLATELGLTGWVNNSAQGVVVEVEGPAEKLNEFLKRLETEKPPNSSIQNQEVLQLNPVGCANFEIRKSDLFGMKKAFVLPDMATCPDCVKEIFDPANRRFRYPFTNCTNCGPRLSIIELLPYDRFNTTMKTFEMCDDCRHEYENPRDRRFHAQPNACPTCGPRLELWDPLGRILATGDAALLDACNSIRDGKIVAMKGLGGFHLIVNASDDDAIKRLRLLKNREEKPLALMYPSLESIRQTCEVSEMEMKLLASPASPITLLKRKDRNSNEHSNISDAVAPGNPYLGVMLPYAPLHHLLMREIGTPIVATSGNLAEETICIEERESLSRLKGIADIFLVHNRPIARHVDDSIIRVMSGREMILRRARGYAPLPFQIKGLQYPTLAVGGHLKNNVAISLGENAFVSQHIGDLETVQSFGAFSKVIDSMSGIYEFTAKVVACDLHPDYLSTKYAEKLGIPIIRVQHHYAHILACMVENELDAPVIGVCWDGTGYGIDGSIWGGEFLRVSTGAFSRLAHFRAFRLPGGEKAIREPRRSAAGLLFEMSTAEGIDWDGAPIRSAFNGDELSVIKNMLKREINSPLTTSAGRLFDAVASLLGLCHITNFEGQAAMKLEFAAYESFSESAYEFKIRKDDTQSNMVDWKEIIFGILDDLRNGLDKGIISAKFHNTLTEVIAAVCELSGEKRVVLSGGCFQNKYLTERTISRLEELGFEPYWHQRIPPNDGGIALGQLAAVSRSKMEE